MRKYAVGKADYLIARSAPVVGPVDDEARMQKLGQRFRVLTSNDAPVASTGCEQPLFTQLFECIRRVAKHINS